MHCVLNGLQSRSTLTIDNRHVFTSMQIFTHVCAHNQQISSARDRSLSLDLLQSIVFDQMDPKRSCFSFLSCHIVLEIDQKKSTEKMY